MTRRLYDFSTLTVISLAVIFTPSSAWATDPPKVVTPADILKADAEIAAAVKRRDAMVTELNKDLARLKIPALPLLSGRQGPRGYSAYEIAKQNGFKGTEKDWLASLVGPQGPKGDKGDPGPSPGPQPPQPPQPTVDPPIKAPGFRVIILHQEKDDTKLKPGQFSAIYGKTFRAYLEEKCVREPDGRAAYRIYDVDYDFSMAPPAYRDAVEKYKSKPLPFLIVSDGKTGYADKLPDDLDGIMNILKKYGGE